MKKLYSAIVLLAVASMLMTARAYQHSHHPPASTPATYLGFDRNDYPGDENLKALHKTFAFSSYWLNNPPGENANSWLGKRETIERMGFGFVVLFNGRSYAQLQSVDNPGTSDGAAAVQAAKAQGFRQRTVIFLDQEEGGRLLDKQKEYIFAWANAVKQGGFRPGIYCSGIEIPAEGGPITTARDLHDSAQGGDLVFWVANDACPPSPGCSFPKVPMPPEASGTPFAEIWQFAQSPVRQQFAASCVKSYNADGNCMPPAVGADLKLHIDVNSARVADPSGTRD